MRRLALVTVLALSACSGGANNGSPDMGSAAMPDMVQGTPPDMTGQKTYDFTLSPGFTLLPGDEQINCYYFPPSGEDRYITRFATDMNAGSHHLVVFRIRDNAPMPKTGPTPCTQLDIPNGFDGMLPGSQVHGHTEFNLPDGVGMKLEKNHGILLQSHYINATKSPITTDVNWSITTTDPNRVKQIAGLVFYSNYALDIAQGMDKATMSFALQQDLNLLTATGHMHKHGLTFDALIDNAPIYHTDNWDSPTNTVFPSPGMPFKANQMLTWTCAYNNDTMGLLHFGNSAATNEMCIFAGIYYPSDNGKTLFNF